MHSDAKLGEEMAEEVEEASDRTGYIWALVVGAIVLMIGGLSVWAPTQSGTSQVTVRHILIQYDQTDPAARARARDLIEDLRRQIVEEGESFAALARDYSNDPGSAARGGMLPPAPRGKYVEAFDNYAWSGPVGEVSDVIQTSHGFHIVEIMRRELSVTDQYDEEVRQRALEEEGAAAPE